MNLPTNTFSKWVNQIMLLPALLLITFSAAHGDDETKLGNTTVKDIVIYRSQAMVTRTVEFNHKAGETIYIIEGLSSKLIANSIEVRGKGDYVILSVSTQLNYLEPTPKSRQQIQLEDSLEMFKKDQDQLANRKAAYNDEVALLQANKNIGGANVGIKTEELIKMADLFRTRLFDLKEKITDINNKEKKLNERVKQINNQLKEIKKVDQPTSRIFVTTIAKGAGRGQFEINYLVNNAGWEPLYNLRSAGTTSKITLEMRAQVYQQTGEKWDKINLKLSTGQPSLGAIKPVLNPWYISFSRPMPRVHTLKSMEITTSGKKRENDEMMQDASAYQLSTAESSGSYTVATDQTLQTEFEVKLPYSIPSDGNKYTIDLQTNDLPASYTYSAVPKLDKDAFLTAAITGWEDMNLVAGKMSIFFEGSFVGESFIDPASVLDTLNVSLGRDKRIVIKRTLLREKSGNQFLGGNRVVDRKYEIVIKNTRKEKIELVLEDQIPVSRVKEIEIKDTDLNGGELNADTGIVTWKLNINPGDTEKKTLGFAVKYPKDKIIIGL